MPLAAVYERVMRCWAEWRIEMSPFVVFAEFCFSSPKTLFCNTPLGSIVALTVSSCRHTGTPLAITGIRGAVGGRQSTAAKPPLYIYIRYKCFLRSVMSVACEKTIADIYIRWVGVNYSNNCNYVLQLGQ